MTKSIILTLTLFFFVNLAQGQLQKDFFVEDANGVDFLRMKFCVNEKAQIFGAEVEQSESIYKNEYVINQIKEYLLGIEF